MLRLFSRTGVRHFSQKPLPITSEEFQTRRAALLRLAEQEFPSTYGISIAAIIKGATKTSYAPDVFYPFKQSSYFRYLCGVNVENSLLYISKNKSVLFIKDVDAHTALWDGDRYSPMDLQKLSGVDEVLTTKEFESYVAKDIDDKHILIELDEFKSLPMIEAVMKRPLRKLIPVVDKLRWRKSAAEIDLMRATTFIGAAAMNATIRGSKMVPNEAHISGQLEYEYRRRGTCGSAYPPVVASGSRAQTIHYLDADQDINPNECVLVDAGCDLEGYVSDITRCFPISGIFSDHQRVLYESLEMVHKDCLNYVQNIRPLKLNELYFFMLDSMAKHFTDAHIFEKGIGEADALKIVDSLCPHHISHYLGLDVHDTFSISRSIDVLSNVIITVEPGVYVRKDIEKIRKEFQGLGYRIEDNVLITKTSAEILTQTCARSADEIEKLMLG